MILLDTHVLLWFVEGDRRLGAAARQQINGDLSTAIMSAMTVWEIAMLADKGKIALAMPVMGLLGVFRTLGVSEMPIDVDMAFDAATLPGPIHRDPADRMLIATARALACPLVTADRAILAYAAAGHVKAIDARQ